MDSKQTKTPPSYAIASVDHALRIATMLQLEGSFSVTEVATRVGVAPSTAHRLMQMLVYRDFAVQRADRRYYAGPVLEIATHSQSGVARLRTVAIPHMQQLVAQVHESSNLAIRTGENIRFIASVECEQALRVGSREGMVFPAAETTAGLLLLADLDDSVLEDIYDPADSEGSTARGLEMERLRADVATVRRAGFAVNQGRSERGIVAIGVAVRTGDARTMAGLSVSVPSVRYDRHRLRPLVGALQATAGQIELSLRGDSASR